MAPSGIIAGPAAQVLSELSPDRSLWNHQAIALERLCAGDNVVVSTGTASGKSLIFQLYALHRLLSDPTSKVLVFYPLRALTSDQHASWKHMVQVAGLPPTSVDIIFGGVDRDRREQILDQARVVLMTPDVCQAWFMRNLDNRFVRNFLDSLALLVLDEAHVYESVFGSNMAFLLRRLLAAKRSLSGQRRLLQMVATTATIADAAQHLHNLTGADFVSVDEASNGAPAYDREVVHVDGPESGADGEAAIAGMATAICNLPTRHRFIAFMDSRQGVERIVQRIGNPNVMPYRSGYETGDRQAIETALRNGTLHGVISTSALELGIDIADLEVGINLGVPQSRKSFRQRLGRIGRSQPGTFFVVASPNAFRQFGEDLPTYYDSSVEPSHLYLGNRFIQFAHARCLRDEIEALGRESGTLPAGVNWPEGFADVFRFALEGWSREFDAVAQIGGGNPHLNYPLRQIVDPSFTITVGGGNFARELGYIAHHQAIREAYPGGHYLHAGRSYRVSRWSFGFGDPAIRVNGSANPVPTRPILRKVVTVDLSTEGIVEGRILQGNSGLIAEVQIQVNESVEGYRIGSSQYRYRDLRGDNPNMRRQQRDFRTTGIIVQNDEEWFAPSGVREQVANGLKDLLCRDRSIAAHDIDSTHTYIALRTATGTQRVTNAVVVFDSVYGGLRLSEPLFTEFERYINQLSRAADLMGEDALLDKDSAERLLTWTTALSSATPDALGTIAVSVPDGWLLVYKPGSIVGIFIQFAVSERELIEPVYRDFFGNGEPQLYYRYRDDRADRYTPHEGVLQVGQDWEWILWNPDTGEYRDLEADT